MSGFEKIPWARAQISNFGVSKHYHGNLLKLLRLYDDDPSPSGVITGLTGQTFQSLLC